MYHINITSILLLSLLMQRIIYRTTSSLVPKPFSHSTPVVYPTNVAKNMNHQSQITLIGSCFSETISKELKERKFSVCTNPQGILFNPISIADCINNVINGKKFSENDIFTDVVSPEIIHSWQHHSSFSGTNPVHVLDKMNEQISHARDHLRTSHFLFVTLGSAFVHSRVNDGVVVANCHKQPSNLFVKKILDIDAITMSLSSAFHSCLEINKNLKIILTVSPVRHTREGMVENNLSKSLLVCAAHSLGRTFPDAVSYFPSYEYMLDELRDYRWYSDDMIHPSATAQRFIFDKFAERYFASEALKMCNDIEALQKRVLHRPIVSRETTAYQNHLERTVQLARDIQENADKCYGKGVVSFREEIEEMEALQRNRKIV